MTNPEPRPLTIRQHARDIQEEAHTMQERLTLSWLESDRDAVRRIVEHAVAILDALDKAEADLFDEHVGMVALVPDGTAWTLRNGVGPWIRTDRPDPLPASRGETSAPCFHCRGGLHSECTCGRERGPYNDGKFV